MKPDRMIKLGYGKHISHFYYIILANLPLDIRPLFTEKWKQMVKEINEDLERDYIKKKPIVYVGFKKRKKNKK